MQRLRWLMWCAGRHVDERDMEEELQFHIDMQARENVRRGLSPERARTEALRSFGGLAQIQEECRSARTVTWAETVWRDAAYGARTLLRNRMFALACVLTLALGIGAATAIFSIVDAVLLSRLPFPDADRLVLLSSANVERGVAGEYVSVPDFYAWQEHADCFTASAIYQWSQIDLRGDAGSERLQGMSVTPGYFQCMGFEPTIGREFTTEEFESHDDVIVISARVWRRRFAADAALVGRTIDIHSWRHYPEIGAVPYRVVGIVDGDLRFPPVEAGVDGRPLGIDHQVDFWLPVRISGDEWNHREWRSFYRGVARLNDDVSVEQAQAELAGISAVLANDFRNTNQGWSAQLTPVSERVVGNVRRTLWLLLGVAATLLMLALVNVASLMLVRGVARRQELATRCALGADRSRLMRQLLTESLLLGMAAGGLGSMLAVGGAALFRRLAPPELPRADEIAVNGNVLLFVIGASVATGLLVGIVPAWFATTAQPGSMLKSSSRTMTRSRGSRWLLNGLAAGSVAVSLTLLIAAALLQQSLLRVLNTDAGFDRRKLLTMTLSLPEASYAWQRNTEFCHDVIAAVQALPGIVNAAAIRGVPTQETRFEVRIAVEHAPELPIDQQPLVRIRVVSPEYFDTMGIGLIAGRALERRDEVGEIGYAHSIVINQAMAERFWPQAQAVGQRIRIAALEGWTEIIGVVSDVRYEGLDQRAVPEMYYPDALFPQTSINLVVRTADAPESQWNAIRSAVLRVEPDALISDEQTMEQAVQKSVADRHFAALIVTAFSVVGFVLAVVGVYGVVSCSVADRRQELAVRLALGARSAHVLGHVLLQGAATSGSGVALGVLLAAIGTRLLSSLLYGIRPIDLTTYACAAALLMLTSTAATIVPAFRAIRIDPVFVLRDQ